MASLLEIPWQFEPIGELSDSKTPEINVRWPLLVAGLALVLVTFVTQIRKPAPWGRFDSGDAIWGPRVHQRVGHMANDGLWGAILFLWLYMKKSTSHDPISLVFSLAWLIHFVHRGFIHPIIAKYSRDSITVGIPATGLTLAFFSYLHSEFFAACKYRDGYFTDPRFVIGAALFVVGFAVNRWADWKIIKSRIQSGDKKYHILRGGLFELVCCPNYFGELVQWIGWAIATCAPCAFVYCLFTAATFFPRSHHTRHWYLSRFKSYPPSRKALIPFIF